MRALRASATLILGKTSFQFMPLLMNTLPRPWVQFRVGIRSGFYVWVSPERGKDVTRALPAAALFFFRAGGKRRQFPRSPRAGAEASLLPQMFPA